LLSQAQYKDKLYARRYKESEYTAEDFEFKLLIAESLLLQAQDTEKLQARRIGEAVCSMEEHEFLNAWHQLRNG